MEKVKLLDSATGYVGKGLRQGADEERSLDLQQMGQVQA